ncbi:MAG: SDR family oxidoreductase [Lacipirellulaceae bacterium]
MNVADPRSLYPRPPFRAQQPLDNPGATRSMAPTPDHGEDSYQGSGRLEGGVAVVTGGDSGIGRAVSIAYAREGADVVVGYFTHAEDAETTAELVRRAGRRATTFDGDLREEAACVAMIDATVAEFGRVTVLVNNAAYQESGEVVEDFSTALFDRIFRTNVYAPFFLSKAALAVMEPGASIINTVSIQGYVPSPSLLPYAASKAALISLTKGFAKLAMERGVRVNAVAPGPVWTPFIPSSMPQEAFLNFGADTQFGRPAQPAELAHLYVWLASPQASYVTAEVYGATGGSSPF